MEAIHCAVNFPNMRIGCFRTSYPELEESFIAELKRRDYARALGAKFTNTPPKKLTFPNGSEIIFNFADTEETASRILGGEYQLFCIDEMSLMSSAVVKQISERLRSGSRSTPVIGLRGATNPGGKSHKYIRDRYIVPTERGKKTYEIISGPEDNPTVRTIGFIQSLHSDNPYLDRDYEGVLNAIEDPNRRAAMRDGDWDIVEGAYFTQWSRLKHVVPYFRPPDEWRRFCGIDYGIKAPFAAIWAAMDNDGRLWVYRDIEMAGVQAEDQAKMILEAEEAAGDKDVYRVADPSMWGDRGTPLTIADIYGLQGCGIAKADNNRLNGFSRFHAALNDDIACEYHREMGWDKCPMIHFMEETCAQIIEALPILPRSKTKPEEPETLNVDDHGCDGLRYLIMMAGNTAAPIIGNDMDSDGSHRDREAVNAYGSVPSQLDTSTLVAGKFAGNLALSF